MPEDLGIQPNYIDRAALANFLPNPRAVAAFENIQKAALAILPASSSAAQTTADDAAAAAASAQSDVDTLSAAAFVVLALSGALSNERQLTGGTGVTLDVATANIVKIVVNVLTILNTAPVVLTQPLTTTALECNSLRVDVAPNASATLSDHSIPINVNGVPYYMRLSTAP